MSKHSLKKQYERSLGQLFTYPVLKRDDKEKLVKPSTYLVMPISIEKQQGWFRYKVQELMDHSEWYVWCIHFHKKAKECKEDTGLYHSLAAPSSEKI